MKQVISTIISLTLAGIIVFTGCRLELKLNEYRTALEKRYETTTEVRKGRTIDFEKLKAKNEDVKGWIWLPNSNIDYPILQAADNDYYLHRDIDKNYLYDGCIFIDYTVDHPFIDFNTVIYGHHMFSGAMFYDLNKFAKEDFFNSHKVFVIETENGSYDLHVVAYCNERDDSPLYDTYFYDESTGESPTAFLETDENKEEISVMSKQEFVKLIKNKAKILFDEEFDETDTFVTLSTCAYNYDDARHQVIGVLREPSVNTVTVEKAEKQSPINKWLILQIVVGLIMLAVLISLIPKKKRRKRIASRDIIEGERNE